MKEQIARSKGIMGSYPCKTKVKLCFMLAYQVELSINLAAGKKYIPVPWVKLAKQCNT